MLEKSCWDVKMERLPLVRRSRKATPEQPAIFISSTIFFQSNFAGF